MPFYDILFRNQSINTEEVLTVKKVIIIGSPGSGKSTFARALCEKTGLPLHYLDMMYWNADRTTVAKDVFLSRLNEALSGDRWIIDGNYGSTMELRFAACDTVFFLDYDTQVCLDGIRMRHGKASPDMPWVELTEDTEFLDFVRKYREESRPKVLSLIEKYSDKNVIVFKTREESDFFLENI